jgi:hypothetical protein
MAMAGHILAARALPRRLGRPAQVLSAAEGLQLGPGVGLAIALDALG